LETHNNVNIFSKYRHHQRSVVVNNDNDNGNENAESKKQIRTE